MFEIWSKIKRLYRNNLLYLIIITLHGVFITQYLHLPFLVTILDWFIIGIITFFVIQISFYLIYRQNDKLQENINELLNSYEYIGTINRKLDELLDLKINLDDTENEKMNKRQMAEFTLTKLIRIINASAGHIHFLHHDYPDISYSKTENNDDIEKYKNIFNLLGKKHFNEIINTQNSFDETKLAECQIPAEFHQDHNIIIKPVYLNKQDLAQIELILPKEERIEEQDIKIIRLFSFYLAAIVGFKK